MQKIKITIGKIILYAELFDTESARAIFNVLPIETSPKEWGDEFYFEIPVKLPLDETATINVKVGDIGYWPSGNALAIFFGPTPMSKDFNPVPAGDVNLIGKIIGDATVLEKVKGADKIRIDKTE